MLVLVVVWQLLPSPHLSHCSLRVGPKVLGCVVSVIPLASLFDAEDAAEGTIGDLVLPLVLSENIFIQEITFSRGSVLYSAHMFHPYLGFSLMLNFCCRKLFLKVLLI